MTTNLNTGAPRAVADTATGIVLATADIAAPPARIFDALTEAKEIEHWWGSPDTYRMTEWKADFRPGGQYTVVVCTATRISAPASGLFIEIDAPHKLSHTRKYDWDHPTLGRRITTITYLLDPIPAGTRITVRHEGFSGCADAAYEHAGGWERVLGWLAAYTESGK